jgi:hypothetical protein
MRNAATFIFLFYNGLDDPSIWKLILFPISYFLNGRDAFDSVAAAYIERNAN